MWNDMNKNKLAVLIFCISIIFCINLNGNENRKRIFAESVLQNIKGIVALKSKKKFFIRENSNFIQVEHPGYGKLFSIGSTLGYAQYWMTNKIGIYVQIVTDPYKDKRHWIILGPKDSCYFYPARYKKSDK